MYTFRLHYDPATHKVYNTPGVQIKAPNFGSTEAFEYLDTSEWSHWSTFGKCFQYFFMIPYLRIHALIVRSALSHRNQQCD